MELDIAPALADNSLKYRSSTTRSWCMHEEYVKELYYARFHTQCYREMHFSCRFDINSDKVDRAVNLQRIAPTYEKFRKNVGVRSIRRGYVFHKLRTRYHKLAYAGVPCHTSNLSKNFVHAQNFQCMPTY